MERLDAAVETVARAGGEISIRRFEGFALLIRDDLVTRELLDFGLDSGRIRSSQLRDGLATAVDQGYLRYDSKTLRLTDKGHERLRSQEIDAAAKGGEILALDDGSFAQRVRLGLAAA